MKRIDEHLRTADRQAGGDGALAEGAHQRFFRLAAQASFGEPRVQCLDVLLGNHSDSPDISWESFGQICNQLRQTLVKVVWRAVPVCRVERMD